MFTQNILISLDGLHKNREMSLISSILSHQDLHKFEFKGFSNIISEIQWPDQCNLKHVTIYECHWDTLYSIITHLPCLRTLVIENLRKYRLDKTAVMDDSDTDLTTNLTSLLVNHCTGIKMNDVEALLSRLPALKHLRLLCPSCERNSHYLMVLDGRSSFDRNCLYWTSLNSRSTLETFSSRWCYNRIIDCTVSNSILAWSKNWCVKCDLDKELYDDEVFHLYSIPLFKNYFKYPEYREMIQHLTLNIAENSATVIVNTCELSLELDKAVINEPQQMVSILWNFETHYFFSKK